MGWIVSSRRTAFRRRLHKHLPSLLDQLSSLVKSGIPMKAVLVHLQELPLHPTQTTYVRQLLHALETGRSLSSVWCEELPPLFVVLFEAGEQTGEMSVVLDAWSGYASERRAWGKKMIRMCTYPCLILSLAVCLFVFLVTAVLPTFLDMYHTLNLQLPRSTLVMLALVHVLPVLLGGLLACCVTAVVVGIYLYKYHPHAWEHLVYHLPGHQLVQLQRSRILCLLLSLLLRAGIPVAESLHVLGQSSGPRWLRKVSPDIERRVLAGESLHRAFAGDWDPLLFILLRWAEQTGDLAEALHKVEHHVQGRFTTRIQTIIGAVEPTLVIGMGAFVAATMLAVFVPMYDLISQVSATPIH